ncbi:recombinase family protein [Pseudomonas putida]|uniref:recombinase family protein n=1 Tax=Pseudomonas putida TaxID=303 RepID=UPI003839E634
MIIGYARVSTDDQNLALQINALKSMSCDTIFTDQGISGADFSRPGLNKALRVAKAGDKLVVWRLDRLGRSLFHLVKLLETLGHREISFQSVTESIDTSSSGGRLVFHMMAALAEFERSLISERTKAGMESARAAGKNIGRPPSLTVAQVKQARKSISTGKHSIESIAAKHGVHVRTITRALSRIAKDKPAK